MLDRAPVVSPPRRLRVTGSGMPKPDRSQDPTLPAFVLSSPERAYAVFVRAFGGVDPKTGGPFASFDELPENERAAWFAVCVDTARKHGAPEPEVPSNLSPAAVERALAAVLPLF